MHKHFPRLSRWHIFLTIVFTVLLAYQFSPNIVQLGDHIRQTHPWSFQHEVERPFTVTADERACLSGVDYADPIPNIVHFIFGLRNPLTHPGAGHFDFLCYLALRSAIVSLRPDKVLLHYTYLSSPASADHLADPTTNPWIKRLEEHITLVNHPPAEFTRPPYGDGTAGLRAAHVSDILRLQLLAEHGGIYLDIDAFALRPFDTLLKSQRDVVLGHEGGNRWGLCNAIMAARSNSTFVRRWLGEYATADLSKEWNYHSVLLPKEMQLDHPDEVCALSPTGFFWPTWTWRHVDFMHEKLSTADAALWQAEIERNAGSLFEDQVAYHAWNQMAYDRYLRHLTPEKIRKEDTRFNCLMRRFIEEDVR